jgi:hypothetical protein
MQIDTNEFGSIIYNRELTDREYIHHAQIEGGACNVQQIDQPLEFVAPELSQEYDKQLLAILRGDNPRFEDIHGEELANQLRVIILTEFPILRTAQPSNLPDIPIPNEFRAYIEFVRETGLYSLTFGEMQRIAKQKMDEGYCTYPDRQSKHLLENDTEDRMEF